MEQKQTQTNTGLLTREGVLAALGAHPWAGTVELLASVDSTNTELKRRAAQGAPHGSVLIAEEQTAGRGRLGRSFDSAPGGGIYLSVLLRPDCAPAELMSLTAQAAMAVRRAIFEACGEKAGIKWVNDLLLGGKKICGILTELSLDAAGRVAWAVVGAGVNCNRAQFPEELQGVAGSILTQTGRRVDRCRLAAAMIRQLSGLPRLDWYDEYRAACLTLGRRVTLHAPGRIPVLAEALDVDREAALVVRGEDGEVWRVASGEATLRQ